MKWETSQEFVFADVDPVQTSVSDALRALGVRKLGNSGRFRYRCPVEAGNAVEAHVLASNELVGLLRKYGLVATVVDVRVVEVAK